MNFCRLPPERDRAAALGAAGLHVEAVDDARGLRAAARRGRSSRRARIGLGAREQQVLRQRQRRAPRRGPGAPRARNARPDGAGAPARSGPTSVPQHLDRAGRGAGCPRPTRRSSSSRWPLPTRRRCRPPRRRARRARCRRGRRRTGPRAAGADRCTRSTTLAGLARVVLQRAAARRRSSCARATRWSPAADRTRRSRLPPRSTVQALHSSRISCSLWLMYRMLQPSAASFLQHHEQLLHRLRRQHRGRLVQDQQLAARSSSARMISTRCISPTDSVCTGRAGSMSSPYSAALAAMLSRHLRERQARWSTPSQTFSATVSVSNRLKCWNTMLMPSARASLRVADVHRLAVPQHAALVGPDRAVDDLHQRRLAGAVLAQHRVGLARQHGERDVVVGHHAPGSAW